MIKIEDYTKEELFHILELVKLMRKSQVRYLKSQRQIDLFLMLDSQTKVDVAVAEKVKAPE